jgi:hypothetical protein
MDTVKSVKVKFTIIELVLGLKKLYPDDAILQTMPDGDERGVPAILTDKSTVTLSWEQGPDE